MSATPGTRWIIGTATEVGDLEEQLGSTDATIRDTWPGQPGAGIVALVEAAPGDVDAATKALGAEAASFDDEQSARGAAEELAASQ